MIYATIAETDAEILAVQLAKQQTEILRLRAALERIRTLNYGALWKVDVSDAIDALVEIATITLANEQED